jgi:Ca2+-binding RTX toxin-like protein
MENVIASGSNVSLVGNNQNNRLTSSYGNDTLDGGLGDDTLESGSGNDFLSDVSGGHDDLYGGEGQDTLWGWSGNDNLYGGGGDDSLDGYSGTQFSVENDLLMGGAGADRFGLAYVGLPVYYQGAGFARIVDFSLSEGDTIQLLGSASSYTFSQTHSGSSYNDPNLSDTGIYYGSDLIALVEDVTLNGTSGFTYI